MRIVFMGTPQIAEESLRALLREGHEIAAVYTRVDKPQGRKQVVMPSPVKTRAAGNRIPVLQPRSLRDPGEADILRELAPDLVVVVAYGMILPPEILEIPKYGCINLHVSLLPKYRGAAPIQWAVINGDAFTGVSIIQIDEGLDSGAVLAQESIEIPPEATAGDMFEIAGKIGARLLAQTVADIGEEKAVSQPQQEDLVTYAPRLEKAMAELDFSKEARTLHNLVLGCNPWPLAWFTCGGKKIKVQKSKLSTAPGRPGTIISITPLTVACQEGSLILERILPEGARAMSGTEWAAGRRFKAGDSIL